VKKLLKRRSEVQAQEFDLNRAIADAVQILSPEAKKRKVKLLATGIQEPLPVRADSIHLQQVILNLARNGMDAMTKAAPSAHTITIQTTLLAASTVEVSVNGSGTGIPEHKLGQIFDTFYTTKEHGTGHSRVASCKIQRRCAAMPSLLIALRTAMRGRLVELCAHTASGNADAPPTRAMNSLRRT